METEELKTSLFSAYEGKTLESLELLRVGRKILDEYKKEIGEERYEAIMNNPINGCKCGFIKEGDETICPKCEEAWKL